MTIVTGDIHLIRICSPYNGTPLETLVIYPRLCGNVIFDRDIHRLRYDHILLRNWNWLYAALEDVPGYFAYRVPSSLTKWVKNVTSWQMQEVGYLGTSRREKFTQIYRYCSRIWWQVFDLTSHSERLLKVQSEIPYKKLQQGASG